MIAPSSNALDRMLAPLADCLTIESAQRLVHYQIDPETRARIDELARKSDEGQLSETERAEYIDYVDAMDLIGILQANARRVLAKQTDHDPRGT